MSRKERQIWSPAEKLRIALESLQSDQRVAELCRREGVAPNLVYRWREQLRGAANAVFARPKPDHARDPQADRLAAENTRLKDVIAEITAENVLLKKMRSR